MTALAFAPEVEIEVEVEAAPTVIDLPATQTEERLAQMLELVKEGRWTRSAVCDSKGRMCALGLIQYVSQ